jgi:hypothetical protein
LAGVDILASDKLKKLYIEGCKKEMNWYLSSAQNTKFCCKFLWEVVIPDIKTIIEALIRIEQLKIFSKKCTNRQ